MRLKEYAESNAVAPHTRRRHSLRCDSEESASKSPARLTLDMGCLTNIPVNWPLHQKIVPKVTVSFKCNTSRFVFLETS